MPKRLDIKVMRVIQFLIIIVVGALMLMLWTPLVAPIGFVIRLSGKRKQDWIDEYVLFLPFVVLAMCWPKVMMEL